MITKEQVIEAYAKVLAHRVIPAGNETEAELNARLDAINAHFMLECEYISQAAVSYWKAKT